MNVTGVFTDVQLHDGPGSPAGWLWRASKACMRPSIVSVYEGRHISSPGQSAFQSPERNRSACPKASLLISWKLLANPESAGNLSSSNVSALKV